MQTTPIGLLIVFGVGLGMFVWNILRIRAYRQQFRYEGRFEGIVHECLLGCAWPEGLIFCRIGANRDALFLMAPPPDDPGNRRPLLGHNRRFSRFSASDLRIPWQELKCRRGRMLLKDVLWFENPEKRFSLYVPFEIGRALLQDASRALSG